MLVGPSYYTVLGSSLTHIILPELSVLFSSVDCDYFPIGTIKGPPHHGNPFHGNQPLKGMTLLSASV